MSQKQKLKQYMNENKNSFDVEEGFNIINQIENENTLHFLDEEIKKEMKCSKKLDQSINSMKTYALYCVYILFVLFLCAVFGRLVYNMNTISKYY